MNKYCCKVISKRYLLILFASWIIMLNPSSRFLLTYLHIFLPHLFAHRCNYLELYQVFSPLIIDEIVLVQSHYKQNQCTRQNNTTFITVFLTQHLVFFFVGDEVLQNVQVIFEHQLRTEKNLNEVQVLW